VKLTRVTPPANSAGVHACEGSHDGQAQYVALQFCKRDASPFPSPFFSDRTSVKIIRGKEDNGLSGSRLGTMLERERVVDLNDYATIENYVTHDNR
jgi:hypothetical protein